MTGTSPFAVRGRSALMVMRDEREMSILRRQLGRLGMSVTEHDPDDLAAPVKSVDVIVPTLFRSRGTPPRPGRSTLRSSR
jgi:hypothetical protein